MFELFDDLELVIIMFPHSLFPLQQLVMHTKMLIMFCSSVLKALATVKDKSCILIVQKRSTKLSGRLLWVSLMYS